MCAHSVCVCVRAQCVCVRTVRLCASACMWVHIACVRAHCVCVCVCVCVYARTVRVRVRAQCVRVRTVRGVHRACCAHSAWVREQCALKTMRVCAHTLHAHTHAHGPHACTPPTPCTPCNPPRPGRPTLLGRPYAPRRCIRAGAGRGGRLRPGLSTTPRNAPRRWPRTATAPLTALHRALARPAACLGRAC